MTYKLSIDPKSRGFYYADSGNDNHSGKSFETPKKTIQAAVDATQDLLPLPAGPAPAQVTQGQGGIYPTAGVIMKTGVSLEGTLTDILTGGPVGVTCANESTVRVQSISNTSALGKCVKVDGLTNSSLSTDLIYVEGDNGVGVDVTGVCDEIIISSDKLKVATDDSLGVNVTATSTAPLDFNFDLVTLDGENTTFFEYSPQSPTDIADLNVSTLTSGTPAIAGSKGLVVLGGTLKTAAGTLDAETVMMVSPAAKAILRANVLRGNTFVNTSAVCVYDTVGQLFGNLQVEGTGLLQVAASNINGNTVLSGTSQASIKCSIYIGDITVNPGCELSVEIDHHLGTLTNSGVVNGIIKGKRYGNRRVEEKAEYFSATVSNNWKTIGRMNLDAEQQIVEATVAYVQSSNAARSVEAQIIGFDDLVVYFTGSSATAAAGNYSLSMAPAALLPGTDISLQVQIKRSGGNGAAEASSEVRYT